MPTWDRRILQAQERHKKEAIRLTQVIQRELPVGTTVDVRKGRSLFEAEVMYHSESWWSTPDYLDVKNLRTGKCRRIHVRDIVAIVKKAAP